MQARRTSLVPSIIPKQSDTLLDDLALTLEAVEHGAPPAARGGRSGDELVELLTGDEAVFKAARVRMRELVESGQIARVKAAQVLTDGLQKIADNLDDIHLSALPRVLDVAHKITGWADERVARLRGTADEAAPRATIVILKEGDPEPPPPAHNEYRLVINLRGTEKQDKRHVIDVTPSKEGGDHD